MRLHLGGGMCTTTRLIVATVFLMVTPVAAQPTGTLRGCITNDLNQPLPRATVVLRAAGVQQTVLADAEGCYEVESLSPKLYRVTVRLAGFDSETRETIRIESADTVRLDFQLRISTICECLSPPSSLRAQWELADAVVHLRVTDHDTQLSAPRGFFAHTAEVLEVFKPHEGVGPDDRAMTFLQSQSSGEPDLYDAGDEVVLFLQWLAKLGTFRIHPSLPGAIAIKNGGTVRNAPVDDLLEQLRALSVRK